MLISCALVWMAKEKRPQRRGYCFSSRKGSGGGSVAATLFYPSVSQPYSIPRIVYVYRPQLFSHHILASPLFNDPEDLTELEVVLSRPVLDTE